MHGKPLQTNVPIYLLLQIVHLIKLFIPTLTRIAGAYEFRPFTRL